MVTSAFLKTVVAGAAVVTLGTMAPAQAAMLTYNWADYDTNTFGSITLNNDILDSDANPLSGLYQGAIVNFSLTSGAFTRIVTNFTENLITLTEGAARLTASGNTNGIAGGQFRFTIDLASNLLPLSDRLVDFDPTSSLWSSKTLLSQVYRPNGDIAAEARRDLDKISAVPEPSSTLALMAIGVLGGVAAKSRNSKKQLA